MTTGRSLDSTILREYDIRGIVGDRFGADDVRAIGRAFGSLLAEADGRTVAVGYDGRLTSPELESALVDGLAACGLTVFRVGRGPSPMLYYATCELNADAGLMITGSHNPPEYNGIKMSFKGAAFFGDDIRILGERVESGRFVTGTGRIEKRDVFDDYISRMRQDYRGTRPLKVAWDPANGAAGEATAQLVRQLPGEHFTINTDIDGRFPAHHPDPTVEKNLDQLKELVARHGCDLGIGFDGDGDRIGVIDSRGRVIWGDQLLVILAREVLAELPGAPIVADVKASQVFFDEIRRMGGQPVLWKAGHSHIKSKMKELDAPLAGEMSAHIFFKHRYYGFDDALYAAVRLLSVIASGADDLCDIYDSLPKMFNTPELRIDCPEGRKFDVVNEVRERLTGDPDSTVNDIDGVRVTTDAGWWLLRASNTQAALVARCEAGDPGNLNRLKNSLRTQLELSGIPVPAF